MKEIKDNYLLISNQKEVNRKSVAIMWQRLCMFLASNVGDIPNVIFTSDEEKWKKYSGGYERVSCFYDEDTGSIVFSANSYHIDNKKLPDWGHHKIVEYARENGYSYIIPLSDIYHEMVHHIQYLLGDWLYNDLLEATAEHCCYMITNQKPNVYLEEMIALWYIGRKILKLQSWEFYIFIRDAIVDASFYKEYFDDPKFVKFLAVEAGGSIEKFFNNMKMKYGKIKLKKQMIRDLNKIHTQLFYRW